jgi:hypothetical protein
MQVIVQFAFCLRQPVTKPLAHRPANTAKVPQRYKDHEENKMTNHQISMTEI